MSTFAVYDSAVETRLESIGMRVDVVGVVMLYTETKYKSAQRVNLCFMNIECA